MNTYETVSATCTISGGDTPINIIWLLNRAPIEPYFEISTEKRGKRVNVLLIESLQAKHAGNYTCRAENNAGSVEHSAELVVIGSEHTTHIYNTHTFTLLSVIVHCFAPLTSFLH